jgi:hypothetical protein
MFIKEWWGTSYRETEVNLVPPTKPIKYDYSKLKG